MGFFKDFKRDFAQAVNELMPDKDELGAEYDDEDMVNTFDEGDLMEVAPEDLLEDLDEIRIDRQEQIPNPDEIDDAWKEPKEDIEEKEEISIFDTVPEAEIIGDEEQKDSEPFSETEMEPSPETEYLEAEKISDSETVLHTQDMSAENVNDEWKAYDALDEQNMLEFTEEALETEPDTEKPAMLAAELTAADLEKAVEDTLAKQEEESASVTENENSAKGEDASMEMEQTASHADVVTEKDSLFAADTTYITKATTINGDISADGCIDLIGTVKGSVSCDGKLIVGGTITGDVKAGELYANAARIEGDVQIVDSAKIGVGTIVVGNVYAGSAVIAGAIKGDIDVKGPVIVDSTAVIMGNIKSKSVQINNGAVIEGMCSQCYSEIDVNSFFD
ncbi:MAG: polymer-forming cytoskeletal protein [Wujia sp.]